MSFERVLCVQGTLYKNIFNPNFINIITGKEQLNQSYTELGVQSDWTVDHCLKTVNGFVKADCPYHTDFTG